MIPNLLTLKFTKLSSLLILLCLSVMLIKPAHAKHILIYGDSLSAAYGMDVEQGWVYLLNESLKEKHRVSNASISGETSAGGVARLALTIENLKPDIIMIALGANDGLRGYSTQQLAENLTSMIQLIKQANITPVVAGISIPPSYGPRYIDQLRAVFPEVANQNDVAFIDMFRDDFLRTPGYMQADDLHPTAITQPIVRDMVKSFLTEQGLLNCRVNDVNPSIVD